MPKRYVVGFLLGPGTVVLVRKERPAWQRGLLNGVGGKVERGESDHDAMVREFEEETGVRVPSWDPLCTITWKDDLRVDAAPSSVAFFRSIWAGGVGTGRPLHPPVKSMTDEAIVELRRKDIDHSQVVPNLTWLIPLAAYSADNYEPFTVVATVEEVVGV